MPTHRLYFVFFCDKHMLSSEMVDWQAKGEGYKMSRDRSDILVWLFFSLAGDKTKILFFASLASTIPMNSL